jgi:predicted PurR-regulated permease PerM
MSASPIARYLTTIVLAGVILWFGKPLLVPLAFALLTAMVLYPVSLWLEKKGLNRSLSVGIPILGLCALFAGLLTILFYQVLILSQEWAMAQAQLEVIIDRVHETIEKALGWSAERQDTWLREAISRFSTNAVGIIRGGMGTLAHGLVDLIIIPIYVALILRFRGKLMAFLTAVVPGDFRSNLPKAVAETLRAFSRFIRGMALVYLMVGVLNSIGLWLLGVENALLYGMVTAVMTIIPYFGILISGLLPITISWLHTGSLAQPIGIIAVFTVVQYVEAYLIYPWIVGRQVNLNTLAALIAIFLGALFWGVSGMILFVPFFAVFRIFASHYPGLKPWARVME